MDRKMRYILMSLAALVLLTGCSAKEMKATVNGWGEDISRVFENSVDHSDSSDGNSSQE